VRINLGSNFWSFLIKGITFLSGIVVSFLISNFRESEDLGIFELSMGVINLTSAAFLTGSNILFLKEIKNNNWPELSSMTLQSLGMTASISFSILIVMCYNGSLIFEQASVLFVIIILGYIIKLGSTFLQGNGLPHLIFIGDNNFSNVLFALFVWTGLFSINSGILIAKLFLLFAVLLLVRGVVKNSNYNIQIELKSFSIRKDLFLSGAFFFIKALSTTGLLVLVSLKANLLEVGTIGVLMRLSSLAGIGLLIYSMSFSVDIANDDSVVNIQKKLSGVRLRSSALAVLVFIVFYLFGAEIIEIWELSFVEVKALLLLILAQIINSTAGPVGIIMAKYGHFYKLIIYSFLSLFVFSLNFFFYNRENLVVSVAISVILMQIIENSLKIYWWNSHKKELL
jgi:hypothetical protein